MSGTRTPAWVIAALVAVGVCVIPAIVAAFILLPGDPAGDGDPGAGPPASLPNSAPASSPAAGEATERDVTAAFRDHVLLDVVRTPTWLDAIERVYWTEAGELWAQTSLSPDADPAGADVRSICGMLSRYIVWEEDGLWAPVSVRASDGSELLGRVDREGSCNPA